MNFIGYEIGSYSIWLMVGLYMIIQRREVLKNHVGCATHIKPSSAGGMIPFEASNEMLAAEPQTITWILSRKKHIQENIEGN